MAATRTKTWAVVALVVGVGGFLLLWRGDESSAVRSTLTRAASGELETTLSENVHADIAGVFTGDGRERVMRAAADLTRDRKPVITLGQLEVTMHGASRAEARFDVVTSGSQPGDLHADTRRGSAELSKTRGGWVIDSVRVEPEARAEPEPRP